MVPSTWRSLGFFSDQIPLTEPPLAPRSQSRVRLDQLLESQESIEMDQDRSSSLLQGPKGPKGPKSPSASDFLWALSPCLLHVLKVVHKGVSEWVYYDCKLGAHTGRP